MRIAIIGAGYVGLTAGLTLLKGGENITIFEKDSVPGGLASGYKEPKWKWSLEKHYHHIFTSDKFILNLAKEVGQEIIFKRPETLTYSENEALRLDNPISLLLYNKINILDRARTGIVLLFLKLYSNWKILEQLTAEEFLVKWMGRTSWEKLWKPLFVKKFGKYSGKIPASWFWARIKKRSQSLGYPKGGFDSFLEKLVRNIRKLKGEIRYREIVKEIVKHKNGFSVKTNKGIYEYDKVICTLPSTLFVRMVKGLPHKYVDKLLSLKGIGAVNLVLELDKPFMDGYWLSVNDMDLPFLCIVEQTNYIEKKYYSGNHIIYIGNYLNQDHEYFGLTAKQLLTRYTAGLKKINSKFDKSWVNSLKVFKAGFAQPLVEKGYLKKVPDLVTPIHGLYLANIEQVYPWDRGTNYSVELGRKVAELTQE